MSKVKRHPRGSITTERNEETINNNTNIIKHNDEMLKLLNHRKNLIEKMITHFNKRLNCLSTIKLETFNPVNTLEQSTEWRELVKEGMMFESERTKLHSQEELLAIQQRINDLQTQNERLNKQNENLKLQS